MGTPVPRAAVSQARLRLARSAADLDVQTDLYEHAIPWTPASFGFRRAIISGTAPRTASTQEVMEHYISGKGPQAAAGPGRRAL